MKRLLSLALLALAAGPALAADNATLITPCATGCVTVRAKDVGVGVQSPIYIPGDTSGNPIWGTAGTANANILTVQGIASMTALKVDGSGVTQPVSGTVTVQQGTAANLNATVTGTVASTQSGSWTVQQGTPPWSNNITQFGGTNLSTGTGAGGLGIPRVTVSNDSNVLATQSGTWNLNNITGTVSLPTGAATSAKQPALGTAGSASTDVLTVQGIASMTALQVAGTVAATQSGNWTSRVVGNAGGAMDAAGQNASSPANELLTACQFNTAPTTVTSGNVTPVQCNNAGALNVNIVAGGGSGGTASSFGAAFPATGTAIGVKNGTNMVNLSADASSNLNVNCAVGCAGGTFNNNADGVATSATNGQAAAWLYAFNGTTWDRLRDDGSKNLNVNCQVGCAAAADHTATGTVTAVNNAVTVSTVATGNVTAIVTADTNITLIFEGTVDGSNWVTLNAYPLGGGASVTTTTANGSWAIPAGGLNEVRLRVTSAGASPTATVSLNAGAGSTQPNVVVNPTAGNLQMTAAQGTTPWVDNITQFGSTNISTGTGAGGAGIPRVTVSNDSNVLATQSGTWNINNVSGTVSLPTGAATSANQPTNAAQGSTTSGQTGTLVQGAVTTSAPSYTTAQTSPLSLDTSGNLRVNPGTVTVTGTVTSNQGTANATPWNENVAQFGGTNISTGTGAGGTGIPRVTVSNDSQVKVWDGTSTNTLKASGTSAATTDTAIVVAPSPNPSDVCTSFKAISQTASTDLITSTNKLHICAMLIVSATAQSVSLIEGTGTVCATGTSAIMGGTAGTIALAANGGFTHTAERPFLITNTTADHLCLVQTGSGNVSGFISYVDHN